MQFHLDMTESNNGNYPVFARIKITRIASTAIIEILYFFFSFSSWKWYGDLLKKVERIEDKQRASVLVVCDRVRDVLISDLISLMTP